MLDFGREEGSDSNGCLYPACHFNFISIINVITFIIFCIKVQIPNIMDIIINSGLGQAWTASSTCSVSVRTPPGTSAGSSFQLPSSIFHLLCCTPNSHTFANGDTSPTYLFLITSRNRPAFFPVRCARIRGWSGSLGCCGCGRFFWLPDRAEVGIIFVWWLVGWCCRLSFFLFDNREGGRGFFFFHRPSFCPTVFFTFRFCRWWRDRVWIFRGLS